MPAPLISHVKPTDMSARILLLLALGVIAGSGLAFWFFGLAFTRAATDLVIASLLPLGVAAALSFALALGAPGHWKMMGMSVALPTVLMSLLLMAALIMEGRFGIGWIVITAAVLSVCLLGAKLGDLKTRKNESGNAA
jgi:hypothetical protein